MNLVKNFFSFFALKSELKILKRASTSSSFRIQKMAFRVVHTDPRRGCLIHENSEMFGCFPDNCPKDLISACFRARKIMKEKIEKKRAPLTKWQELAGTMPRTGKMIMKNSWSGYPEALL